MHRHLIALLITLLWLGACAEIEFGSASQEVITERNATITAGLAHTCAVDSGSVRCWGRNNYGQLGNNSLVDSASPVVVSGITTAVMVSAGDYHTCAVLANGTARCWGLGSSGQLGTGSTANRQVPGTVSGLGGVQSISAGGSHTCASLDTGQLRCWGANTYGQLGTNSLTQATTPQVVVRTGKAGIPTALTDVLEVEVGKASSCARTGAGYVYCWGRNNYGQLGDATSTNHSLAMTVSNLSGMTELSVGDYHACAVHSNGRVSCWGMNLYGQLGDNSQTARTAPVQMQRRISPTLTYPIVNVSAVAAGGGHTCVRSAGEVWCAGRNDNGELGRDLTGYLELLAVPTAPLVHADEVATGDRHTCARRPGGAIVCFGRDTYGQVGGQGRCPSTPTARIASITSVDKDIDEHGSLVYTDGETLDVVVETTGCAQISTVAWKYGPIGPGDPIEPSNAESYTVTSTVDSDTGARAITVRVHWDNVGTGITFPAVFTVEAPSGATASAGFTLVEAHAIDGTAGRIDMSRDELLNEVLGGIYEKFGDNGYFVRNGINLYDFDYAGFELRTDAGGIHYSASFKADLIGGSDPTDGCNPTVYSWGTFTIQASVNGLTTQWVNDHPGGFVWVPLACSVPLAGVPELIALFAEAVSIRDKAKTKLEKRVKKFEEYCAAVPGGCAVIRDVTHVDGGVTVNLNPLVKSVTFRVPYNTQIHGQSAGDPMRRGIGVPIDEPIVIVSGGLATACYGETGTCTTHNFGAAGLFNWQWPGYDPQRPDTDPHPPIPDPWPDCTFACFFEGRQGPWLRQAGLSRNPSMMYAPAWNPGGLVGRVLHDNGSWESLMFLGDLLCRVDAPGGGQARIVIGRNDVSNGPFSGEYGTGDGFVTFNFAPAALASSAPACSTVPGWQEVIQPPIVGADPG